MRALAVLEAVEAAVDPPSPEERGLLAALGEHLGRVLPPGRGDDLERRAEFPDAELRAFAREGFVRELIPDDQGGALDWSRAMRIASRYAAHDLDVTLCLGGAVLGGMPVLVAGGPEHRARYFGALARGEMGAFALSEWDHGSDLLAIEARAEVDGGGFRLFGTKSPVNNGTRGANVVVLARTGEVGDPFGYSLFLVPHDIPGVRPAPRLAPVGFRCMDLSGITLDGALLPASTVLGRAGEGFTYARRALEVTRSGVAMMATGPQATCLALAVGHARGRVLYGSPIGALGGVQAIVARAFARLAQSSALARRAARVAARWPLSARAWSSAAKLACPALLEESVAEVGTLLGARSLLDDFPFARLRRAAPVLAIFDGSSQLQLDELWRYAAQWRVETSVEETLASARALRDPARVPFDAALEAPRTLEPASPPALLGALASALPGAGLDRLAVAARAIARVARDARRLAQRARFRTSSAAAELYGLGALAEATALAEGSTQDMLRSALVLRVGDTAPRLAAALVALGAHVETDFRDVASEVLALASDDDATVAAGYAAAASLVPE